MITPNYKPAMWFGPNKTFYQKFYQPIHPNPQDTLDQAFPIRMYGFMVEGRTILQVADGLNKRRPPVHRNLWWKLGWFVRTWKYKIQKYLRVHAR